jgi:hypothetical protein
MRVTYKFNPGAVLGETSLERMNRLVRDPRCLRCSFLTLRKTTARLLRSPVQKELECEKGLLHGKIDTTVSHSDITTLFKPNNCATYCRESLRVENRGPAPRRAATSISSRSAQRNHLARKKRIETNRRTNNTVESKKYTATNTKSPEGLYRVDFDGSIVNEVVAERVRVCLTVLALVHLRQRKWVQIRNNFDLLKRAGH